MPTVERPPILVPRAIRKDVKDDPFVRARDYEQAAARLEPAVREALERGERHAFVATDLLWVDGTSLADVPLLERSGSWRACSPSRTSSGSRRTSGRRRC